MKKRAIAIISLWLMAAAGQAQELSPELQSRLRHFQDKPPTTEKEYDELERMILAISREILLSGLSEPERARLERVQIAVVAGGETGPPAWIEGDTIFVSSDASSEVGTLGMYLGHDLYIDSGATLDIPQPLLTRPFAASRILSLRPTLAKLFLMGIPLDLIKCPKTLAKCAEPQAAAIFVGTLGFLIAHEMAHLLLGHEQQKVRSLDEELAADRKAWSILRSIAPEPEENDFDSLEYRIRVAIEAGPFLLLRWQLDSQAEPDLAEGLHARLSALWKLATPLVSADVSTLVEPASVVGRLRSLQIRWTERPEELYIDGVKIVPEEVATATLRVFDRARLFARREGRFAYHRLDVVSKDQPETVSLLYRAPSITCLEDSELRRLQRERDWFGLFLATTTPDLKPRPGIPAKMFYRSLEGLGLGHLIDPALQGLDHRVDRLIVKSWWHEAQPLGTWRPLSNNEDR